MRSASASRPGASANGRVPASSNPHRPGAAATLIRGNRESRVPRGYHQSDSMTESAAIPVSTRLRIPLLPGAAAAGFAIALVAVGVIAWFSYESQRATGELRARVTHTVSVVDGLQSLKAMLVDAETGQRGYLITGEEAYLEPYTAAQMSLPGALSTVRALISNDAAQVARFEAVAGAATQRAELLEQTIALRRSGDAAGAADLDTFGPRQGADGQDQGGVGEMLAFERARLQTLQAERDVAAAWSLQVTLVGSGDPAVACRCRGGHDLPRVPAARIRGLDSKWAGRPRHVAAGRAPRRIPGRARPVLSGTVAGAPVGAFYILEEGGNLRRVAGYGLSQDPAPPMPEATTGLPAQASRDRRILYFENVPADHLPVVSGLGKSQPRTVAVMPALVDGEVMGVVEIGLFDGLAARERELLVRRVGVGGHRHPNCQGPHPARGAARGDAAAGGGAAGATGGTARQQRGARRTEPGPQGIAGASGDAAGRTRADQHPPRRAGRRCSRLQKRRPGARAGDVGRKAAELERANQYKSEFLANMCHELRTPLNSSLILAKLLADNKDGNLTAEQVQLRADDLVCRQRPADADQRHPRPREDRGRQGGVGDRAGAARARRRGAVQRRFEPLAARKGAGPSASSRAGHAERIETDAQRLGQILKNLLSNAVKFTERGEVTLRVSRRRRRRSGVRGARHRHRHPSRTSRKSSSRRSDRPTAARTASTAAPAWASRSRAIWRACSAATSRSQSTPGRGQHVHADASA